MSDARPAVTPPSNPPRTWFGINQRLLRGYGPAAVMAVLLLAMSVLVPSRSPSSETATFGGDGSGFSTGDGSGTGTGTGGTGSGAAGPGGAATPGAAGTPGAPGAADPGAGGGNGEGVPASGATTGCPDRAEQVPGDPYSPPCVAFEGANGGGTARGVSDTEIRISYRQLNERGFQQTLAELAGASITDTPADIRRTIEAYAEYFNQNFQFYGRRMAFQFYDGVGSNTSELTGGGQQQAAADAETVNGMEVFADMSGTSEPYSNALTGNGIMHFGTPYLSREYHVERAPLAWSLATDGTVVAELAAEFAANRLAGGNADLAGGELQGRPRVIATVAPENQNYQQSVQASRARFSQLAGTDPGPNFPYRLSIPDFGSEAARLIPQMQSQGVTTIICGCDPIFPVFFSGEAARQGYFPEFVIAGTAFTDADIVAQLWNQEFASHAFGISSLQEFVPAESTIAAEAFRQVRPGEEPAFSAETIYYQMYMLAIGIQMAGPNLTYDSFAQGMFDYPARVGPFGLWDFGPDDFTAANDVREIFYDPNATSRFNNERGAYVDPNPGQRYTRDQLPSGPPTGVGG